MSADPGTPNSVRVLECGGRDCAGTNCMASFVGKSKIGVLIEQTRRYMRESEFWAHLEHRLSRDWSLDEEHTLVGLFCDGFIAEDYDLESPPRVIKGKVWVGLGRGEQEPWRFEFRVPGDGTTRDHVNWETLLPDEGTVGWVFVDQEEGFVLIDPLEACSPSERSSFWSCPCCGYKTMSDPYHDSYEICAICFWEDSPVQFASPDYGGGANVPSLREARLNFERFGAYDKHAIRCVRPPTGDDLRLPRWQPEL